MNKACSGRLAVLFAVASLSLGLSSAPAQASETPYVALVVRCQKNAYNWTVESLEQALANVGAWAPRGTYGRTASRMHIRDKEWTKTGTAKRVGTELGLSNVLFVAIRTSTTGGETRTFADVELVDVHAGVVLVKRSYYLPDRRMSMGTATYIADFLALRLNVRRHDTDPAAPAGGEAPGVAQASRFGEMHGRDLDDAPPPPAPAPNRHPRAKKSSVAFLQGIL